MMKYHENYQEYFDDIVKIYNLSFDNKQSTDDGFNEVFRDYLMRKIKLNWQEYEFGKREAYYLTETDLENIIKKAQYETTIRSITKLSDMGFLQALIKSNGEIVYSLTEEGKKLVDSLD